MHHVPRPLARGGNCGCGLSGCGGGAEGHSKPNPVRGRHQKGPFGDVERAQLYLGFIFCLKVSLGFVCVVECCEVSWLGVERLAEAQAYLSARV